LFPIWLVSGPKVIVFHQYLLGKISYFVVSVNHMHTARLYILIIALHCMLPARAQLLINEVMAVNTSGAINPLSGEPGDWIEIYNGTGYPLDLAGYCLSDDRDEPLKWDFPEPTYLAPGRYHLVWADGSNSTAYGSHANFKLGVEGETLFLHDRMGVLYDSMSFPAMHENISYGYSMDGSALYFKVPTPGGANNNGSGFLYAGKVAFDPNPAVFPDPVEVHITSDTPQGSIRYTLDGSPPGPDDPIYSAPIMVSENTVVRAQLLVEGFEPGAIATASYIINEAFSLPVVSISTDPHHLFDDRDGIYVEGSNGLSGYCMDIPVNWNRNWERPLSFEYFDLLGARQIQVDGGCKIHGGCSRTRPMKSLAFFARSKYGSNKIEYPFFSQKQADTFKGLILRNSGNDFKYTLFRDAMIQAVVEPVMDVDAQAYEPVQVFLNGEYWGIHNLREKINEHWVTSNYGIPSENLDFIKNKNEVFAGSREGIDELNLFLRKNRLASDQNFQQVANWVNLESYTDYLITQLFFANRDWPGNNQKYWRNRVSGSKWRWILFDLDYTMGIYKYDASIDMFSFSTAPDLDEWPNPAWSTLLIRRLLENETFRDRFIQKYLVHLNTTFDSGRVNHVIDSFYNRLYHVFPAHIERWGRPRSMEEWEEWVDLLRLFASERPNYVRENMRNFFSLEEEVPLEVKAPDQRGLVKVNGVVLPQGSMKGSYPVGLDLNLEFQAVPGYAFNSWEVISQEKGGSLKLFDSSISLVLHEGTTIRATAVESETGHNSTIRINEIVASNQGAHLDEYGEDDDWIELYNAGESATDLAGLYLTDDLNNPAKWKIPAGYPELTTIGSGDHLVFYADGSTLQGPLHMNFKLSSEGESIGLSVKKEEAFIWLDSIRFGPQSSSASYGRYPDGEKEWLVMNLLTPNQANRIGPLSIETEIMMQWSVFPNPTSNWLNISIDNRGNTYAKPWVLAIRDLTGRQIEERSIQLWQGLNHQRLDLTALPAGIYILTLESDSGLLSKKIVKSGR